MLIGEGGGDGPTAVSGGAFYRKAGGSLIHMCDRSPGSHASLKMRAAYPSSEESV